jgi:membrane protein DedA with SNARE-associated domain/membrane-associated phospholipid phosphatase
VGDGVKPVWLAAAVLLAVFLVLRRRRLDATLLVGGALAVAAMLVYGLGLVHLPNVDEALKSVGKTLGAWTYLLVGVMAFLETGAFIGLLAPGETVILIGGVVAGQGKIDIVALIAIIWACAVAGDVTSFFLGRRLGRAFLVKHGPKVQITEERLHTVEGFFDRHGGKAIFLGRFVGLVRAVAPFLAGSSGMPLRRFLPYDVLGAGLWGTTFALLGFFFWRSIDQVLALAKQGALALAAVIVLVVALVWLVRWVRAPEHRRQARDWLVAQEGRPVAGPVVRLAMPVLRRTEAPARFVWNRVTPGDLGLELTSVLALASVGSFVFFGYLIVLADPAKLTAGDRRGLRWSDDLRAHWLDQAAKLVTHLGTLPVAGGAVLLAAAVLLARRDVLEGASLLCGMALTVAGSHIAKAFVDRPRPPHPLTDTAGSAYPSGHAAYAAAWIAIAVALRRAVPGLASEAAVLVAGIVVAVAVGLTRIYLRVHWFSDVAGGLGLGVLCFSLTGLAALVVAHLRQNPRGA